MISVDLDGTLLGGQIGDGQHVSQANHDAIQRAVDAGVAVVVCTGRAWRESHHLIRGQPVYHHGVFVGGAAVSQVDTGQSVDLAVMEPHLARAMIDTISQFSRAALALCDPQVTGLDYLVIGDGDLDPSTSWWFEQTRAKVRRIDQASDQDLHHILRVGLVTQGQKLDELMAQMHQQFAGRAVFQSFEAVNRPDPKQSMYILEAFAPGVDKWRGLRWIADDLAIEDDQIAAIGDEINDLPMITQAGCGIAMANGTQPVRDAADYITASNFDDGVARAIHALLDGQWE